eukprot:ANDGO_03256.mRNA.1 Histone RNA hairpin-binding protein
MPRLDQEFRGPRPKDAPYLSNKDRRKLYSGPILPKSEIKQDEQEIDDHKLVQRQKQIDFGKNTIGYQRYLQLIPKMKRNRGDPQTPNPQLKCSKRTFDDLVKNWRRGLHKFDDPTTPMNSKQVSKPAEDARFDSDSVYNGPMMITQDMLEFDDDDLLGVDVDADRTSATQIDESQPLFDDLRNL